jgi:NADH:ubiquinone oxidoreductase subunit F (NADH-binding)
VATILKTPSAWPQLLLDRKAASQAWDDSAATLDAAVKGGAFEGLKRSVHELGPVGTIATIVASGLRGRGGGGFPTGEKWRIAART